MTQMCTYFKRKTDGSSKSDRYIFFLFWLSEHLSTGKILSEKKYGGSSELCPDWEAASRSGNFFPIKK